MAKFVTFDDGYGTYQFRSVFPSKATKKEIYKTIERKLLRDIKRRGGDRSDFDWDNIKDWTTIRTMKDGVIYTPEFHEWHD